jgi:signal transduction histidine kinase
LEENALATDQTELEPGFLQAYRLFVVTRIVFWMVIGPIVSVMQIARDEGLPVGQSTDPAVVERLTLPNVAPVIAIELALLALLVLPPVPRRMGKWFVPVTIAIGLVPILLGYYWWPAENPLQSPFTIFFFVMLVLIAWQVRFRNVIAYVLGLTLFQGWLTSPAIPLPFSVEASWLVLQAAMMLLVGYVIVQLVSIQREQREALAEAYQLQTAANRRLQRYAAALQELATSRERNRLARELHDTLAHSLSALTVQLEAVRSLWNLDPAAARRQLDQADQTARHGLTEARRALRALRASPLQDLGLALALRELAQQTADGASLRLDLRLPERITGRLAPEAEQGIYRIAQETVDNIVRHAEARQMSFHLEQEMGELVLTVEDDGRGFDPEASEWLEGEDPDRLGIRGMQERASLIGGQLEIARRRSQGTRVRLTVPFAAAADAQPTPSPGGLAGIDGGAAGT